MKDFLMDLLLGGKLDYGVSLQKVRSICKIRYKNLKMILIYDIKKSPNTNGSGGFLFAGQVFAADWVHSSSPLMSSAGVLGTFAPKSLGFGPLC